VIGSAVGSIANSDNGNYSVTGWQLRQGNAQTAAQYGINFAAFDWNIGALEGGDVSVTAGRDVTNILRPPPTAWFPDRTRMTADVAYGAGGGLLIRAGGDIGSAQVFVADGVGTLIAGGGSTAVRTGSSNPLPVVPRSLSRLPGVRLGSRQRPDRCDLQPDFRVAISRTVAAVSRPVFYLRNGFSGQACRVRRRRSLRLRHESRVVDRIDLDAVASPDGHLGVAESDRGTHGKRIR